MLRKKLNRKTSEDTAEDQHQNKKLKGSNQSGDETDKTGSKYFSAKVEELTQMSSSSISEQLINIAKRLNMAVKELTFPKPVQYCYNPVKYASKPHETYINRFCATPKDVVFIGMNPGPFGMCQTGVPFGEITHVRDWMKIDEEVGKPEIECPTRPIQGFDCTKSEQSGLKFWGLFKNLCETPERFFKHAYVYNYCPMGFMDNKGKNITPNMIKVFGFY